MRKVLITLLACCLSCEDSLDLEPKMYISADEAFSNRENVLAVLTGCYDALQLQHYYGRNFIILNDLASDNSRATGTKVEYYSTDDNSLLADNILVEGIWSDIYTGVNRVNYMLHRLEDIDFLEADEKEDMCGQLCFLRALHYFNLVRLYGAVPLKLSPTQGVDEVNFLPRAPVDSIYGQIVTDLNEAIGRISNEAPERATLFAARSLLALVYLTRGFPQEAFDLASAVFEEYPVLESDYPELFGSSGEPSPEILFYVPFQASDKNRMAEYHLPNQLGGRYENSPSEKLQGLFETGDLREEMIAGNYGGKSYTRKYNDLVTGSDRVLVLRNTENLFIMAEAACQLDTVVYRDTILACLNRVRERAGLEPLGDGYTGGLKYLVQRERQLEFAFEGKRWFDLLRTGMALEEVPTVTSTDQLLLPLPLSEILSNPEIGTGDQNPGY
jgi:hypothetical protein